MSAPLVKGDSVLVGFPDSSTVTGVIRDIYEVDTTADIEHVRNEDNEEATAIVSNPGARLIVDGVCTASTSFSKGDICTINSIAYICEAAKLRYTKTTTRFSGTFYKPDGATYSGAPAG